MSEEFVLKRGLKNIYAAEILTDDNEDGTGHGYTTGTPFHLIPAGEMSRKAENEKKDVYYDNGVFRSVGKEGATEISITGAALRPADLARLSNKYVDPTTGAIIDTGEYKPKYFAIGGEAGNDDGTSELFWFAKGTFAIPEQEDKTEDDSTDANGMSLTYSAVRTNHLFTVDGKEKGIKQVNIDTGTTEVKSSQSWTAQVVTPENLSTICQKITSGNVGGGGGDGEDG